MPSTFNVAVRLTGAQTRLILELLADATDEHDDPTSVAGATRKLQSAYDSARAASRRNRGAELRDEPRGNA